MIDLNGKTILVTGSSGFIATNFIEMVLNEYPSCNIIAIDVNKQTNLKVLFGFLEIWGNRIEDIPLDEFKKYCRMNGQVEYIFNFAAESHVDRSIHSPKQFLSNYASTMYILEYMVMMQDEGVDIQLVQVSTDEVYGHHTTLGEFSYEGSPLSPRNPYSASKAGCDLLVESFMKTHDINAIITRCTNNFGKYQFSEKFIPTIINALKNGEKIPVYGAGDNVREWIDAKDHNKSILDILDTYDRGVYNIYGGTPKTNLELISDILRVYNDLSDEAPKSIETDVKFVEDRKGHDKIYSIASSHYKRSFGLIPYEESLEDTVKYYMDNEIKHNQ